MKEPEIKTWPLLGAILFFLLGVGMIWWGCNSLIKDVNTTINQYYDSPDTTITYKNGKYDTVIVKKSKPAFLK